MTILGTILSIMGVLLIFWALTSIAAAVRRVADVLYEATTKRDLAEPKKAPRA